MYKFVCRNCGRHFSGSRKDSKCPSCRMTGERDESSSSSYSHSHSYDHDDDYSFGTGSSGSSFDSFDSFGGGFSDGGGCSGDW